MSQPHIVVAGLGRCGTSLTMQMLCAAGVPCVGTFPDFEVDEVNHRPIDAGWLACSPDHAVKVLNPHQSLWPRSAPRVVLWCERDALEQAKSQAKFLALTMGLPVGRAERRLMARGIAEERASCFRGFCDAARLTLRFERTLFAPAAAAADIARFLAPWRPGLDVDRMAAAVIPRSPACAPGLDIEAALVEQDLGRRRNAL